ncbi:MAG TPA: 2-amino-4-hydroxy-6-hydroxymethyldihydropteridine diphosphokinase [Candidatus Dormibacteraeota bacterium]
MTPNSPLEQPSRAVLSLGSNLGRRGRWLDLGLETLRGEGIVIQAATPRWNTRAIGAMAQPDFLNQLILGEADLTGPGWLDVARLAEERAGRRRHVRRGPRTLDVDVILIQGQAWDSPELTVPHPGLLERPYLLRGASLLVPNWIHPTQNRSMAELARDRLAGAWSGAEVTIGQEA